MDNKYTTEIIEKIWGDSNTQILMHTFWLESVKWRKKCGWKDADKKVSPVHLKCDTHHEVIDSLHAFINGSGLVNAHAGFTSSDVIDNVRLKQCADSQKAVRDVLLSLVHTLGERTRYNEDVPCVGYTHWQVATRTSMKQRFLTMLNVLMAIDLSVPLLRAKHVGGGTGTDEALRILMDEYTEFNPFDLATPLVGVYMQSTDHTSELKSMQWLEGIAAQVHKIAQDIRFLCSTGEASIKMPKSYRGSSAMAGKTNPQDAEQICGLARLQPNYTRAIWDAMAFNGMERTLDNSAMLRVTLPDAYNNAYYILTRLESVLQNLEVNKAKCFGILEGNHNACVEIRMAEKIRDGMTWPEAYRESRA